MSPKVNEEKSQIVTKNSTFSISKPLFLSFFLCSMGLLLAQEGLRPRYHAQVQVVSSTEVKMDLEVTLSHNCANEIKSISWINYPNRFLSQRGPLDDINYYQYYPGKPSQVQLKAEAYLEDDQAISLHASKTLMWEMPLINPLAAGREKKIKMRASLVVPRQFGTFGQYRKDLFLLGLWMPVVASHECNSGFDVKKIPPQANWKIKIDSEIEAFLSNQKVSPKATQTFEFPQTELISLRARPKFHSSRFQNKNGEVHVHFQKKETKKIIQEFEKLSQSWMSFIDEEYSHEPFLITFIQTPLRDLLVQTEHHVSYFSDRAFKVVSPLRKYHSLPIIQGMFKQFFTNIVHRNETQQDAVWVEELISWSESQRWFKKMNLKNQDARQIKSIKLMSFLPSIDQVLYSPQFSFVDTFYNNIYSQDPIKDHPIDFFRTSNKGRIVFENMTDQFGEERVSQVVQAYTNQLGQPFINIAEAKLEKSLKEEFEFWLSKRKPINYKINKIESKKSLGKYQHKIQVVKEGADKIPEPIDVKVEEKNLKKNFIWNDKESIKEFEWESSSKIKSVEIDPRGRRLETKKSDNRYPPRYKFILTEIILNYDVNQKEPLFLVSGLLRKISYDPHRFHFSGSYFGDTYGAGVGYSRLFGRFLDGIRMSHGVSFGASFSHVDHDYALAVSPSATRAEKIDTEKFLSRLSATYFFGDQLSYTNPMRGGGLALSWSYGPDFLSQNKNYYEYGIGSSWVFPLHPNHLIATRVSFSSSSINTPTLLQSRLGGLSGMKSLSFDEDRFKGRHLLILGSEYRHFLLQDIDVNFGLFRLRNLQGALGGDVGNVTATLQEKANQQAFGGSQTTHLKDLFQPNQFQVGIGYGLRFHVDYLGVNPGLLSFDLHKSLTQWDQGLQYYFGVTQSY